MANYIIEWSDKSLKSGIILQTGVVDDTTTSLTLYGRNSPNWGEKSEENLIHLLEHFASNGIPPRSPTLGQLWYDASTKLLKVYWNDKWNEIGYRKIASPTVPTENYFPGTLWFNTTTNKLFVRNNAGNWIEILQDSETASPAPTPVILPTPSPTSTHGTTAVQLSAPTNPLILSAPIIITQDNQVVEDLNIVAVEGSAGILNNGFKNVIIRNCFIQHDQGPGIDLNNADFTIIDHVVIDSVGSPDRGANATVEAYNIHGRNSDGVVIGNVELYNGSSGIFLDSCDSPHIYTINGFNFRGPQPRGEFIYLQNCKNALIEDFYNKNEFDVAWTDSNIHLHNCSNPTVRRGCVDGSNGSLGAGVQITYDNGISFGGLIESVDAVNMGNGAFSASPGQDVSFRYCRAKDNHNFAVGGRLDPISGGLIFEGVDGNLTLNPNNIAANIQIEGCTLWNVANSNNVLWDPSKFSKIEFTWSDFTPRSRIFISNMPNLGASPTPVGPSPAPLPTGTPAPIQPPTSTPSPVNSIKPAAPNPANYPQITFNEDFNTTTLPSIFVDHLWYLTSDSTINYSVEGGELLIWPEANFVNRYICTDGLFEQRYGFFEMEAKLPTGLGCAPVFWLFAHPVDDRPEIDVMLAYSGGTADGWADAFDHPIDYAMSLQKANANYSYHEIPFSIKLSDFGLGTDLSVGYHKYGVRWTQNEIVFFFDGQQVGNPWVNDGYFSKPMYPTLGLTFGSASGTPNLTDTPVGKANAMHIKYLRAWNLSDGTTLLTYGSWLPASSNPVPTPTPAPTVPAPVPTPTSSGSTDPLPFTTDQALLSKIGVMSFRDEFTGDTLNTALWRDRSFDENPPVQNYSIANDCLNVWPQVANGSFFRRSFQTGGTGAANAGTFYQKYGYFEMEAILPIGLGCWPAFWLYNSEVGNFPTDTTWLRPEIDILEAYPGGSIAGWWGTADFHPTNYAGTVWAPNVCDQAQSCQTMEGSKKLSDSIVGFNPATGPDLSAGFHKYACLWDATGVEFFFDGGSIGKVNTTDQNMRMYIILDLWFGSASGTPNTTDTPQGAANSYSINYVRAWKLSNGSSEVSGSYPPYVPVSPTPVPAPTPNSPPAPIPTPAPTVTPTAPSGQPTPYGQNAALYTGLTFQDEFNGSSLDFSKWTDQNFYGPINTLHNYAVQNGALYIWPATPFTKENRTITTDGKFRQQYGFYEIEAKLPVGTAVWPAFWLYDHSTSARPEIDIMEAYSGGGSSSGWSDSGLHPNNYGMTLHDGTATGGDNVLYAIKLRDYEPWKSNAVRLDTNFHKYAMRWDASGITFYFDGQQVGSKWSDNTGYFHRTMYILLDLWLGSGSGQPDSTTITGSVNSFIINYVRVWQIK